jgi:glycosyltransferase involved in cell wall biosynthesis
MSSLIKQNYPPAKFEIIVVDDNSTDNTLKRIKKVQQKYPRLKIIELKDKPDAWTGKTWASEKGYLKSRYDILLFVDADCYYKNYYKNNCLLSTISYMLEEERCYNRICLS